MGELENEEWRSENESVSESESDEVSDRSRHDDNAELEEMSRQEGGTGAQNDVDGQRDIITQAGQQTSGGDAEQGEGGSVSNTRLDGQNVVVSGYLNDVPTALSENEFKWEMLERENRKKNLSIRGIRTVGKGIKNEIKEIVRKYMNLEIYITNIRALGGGVIAELESFENKVEILKRKGTLKGIDLWLEDDYTTREKQIQEWLEKIAEEEARNSADNVVNRDGLKLLKMCEELGARIKNGNTKRDWKGRQTYIRGGGACSVLDLLLEIENAEGSVIDEIKIRPRVESDHLPVEIYIVKKRGAGSVSRE